jgi:hypothetical protein
MNCGVDCARAEILAGAIALGEANDENRHAYRGHLASCRRCLDAIGGEREIERVMNLVARARDQESWQPEIRTAFAGGRNVWRWGAVAAAAAIVALTTRGVLQERPVVVPGVPAPPQSVSVSEQELRGVAALGTQAGPKSIHRAESLAFIPTASGTRTVTLRVSFDQRGKPVRCVVVSTGIRAAAGAATCAAVMRAR